MYTVEEIEASQKALHLIPSQTAIVVEGTSLIRRNFVSVLPGSLYPVVLSVHTGHLLHAGNLADFQCFKSTYLCQLGLPTRSESHYGYSADQKVKLYVGNFQMPKKARCEVAPAECWYQKGVSVDIWQEMVFLGVIS